MNVHVVDAKCQQINYLKRCFSKSSSFVYLWRFKLFIFSRFGETGHARTEGENIKKETRSSFLVYGIDTGIKFEKKSLALSVHCQCINSSIIPRISL